MPDVSDFEEPKGASSPLLAPRSTSEDPSDPSDAWVPWKDVYLEELDFLEFMDEHRERDFEGLKSGKFALAFSGGGIRAAAFQSGVLWQLAKQNRLKDVTYLCAVSGGGYIASAFASHCAGSKPPRSGKEVKGWYLQVVAETIVRMQENAGNFVRDGWARPWHSSAEASPGAGRLPRILDLPVLLNALFWTLALHPTMYVSVFLIPTTVFLEVFFGPGMRGAFCYTGTDFTEIFDILYQYTPIQFFARMILSAVSLCILSSILASCCCKAPRKDKRKSAHLQRSPPTFGYLVGHAVTSFLIRFSVVLIIISVIVGLSLLAQIWSYPLQQRQGLCTVYKEHVEQNNSNTCVDYYRSIAEVSRDPWWHFTANETVSSGDAQRIMQDMGPQLEDDNAIPVDDDFYGLSIWGIIGVLLLSISACMCLLLPCLGAGGIVLLAAWLGPIFVLGSSISVIQFAVFGPITGNMHGSMGPYTDAGWKSIVNRCLVANIFFLIFYEELRSTLHIYYKRCLQKNFFKNGQDIRIGELAKDFYNFHKDKADNEVYKSYNYGDEPGPISSGASYCPLLILTATSSDYQSPGDEDEIAEVSLTPLHTGGEETYYVRTPRSRSLAKCTALTGAGCLDAITLSMSKALYLRFWLEALNLSWGDYLIHAVKRNAVDAVVERLFDNRGPGGILWSWEDVITRLVNRIPGGSVWLVSFAFVLVGWWRMQEGGASCSAAASYFSWSLYLTLFMVLSSFLSFLPIFNMFSQSSFSRFLLQLTKYTYVGKHPPRALYCTDGGVQDCTALVQLMRRHCPQILLVLAAADPKDELNVLRTAMECATEERIGSFFDPKHPERAFKVMLDEYAEELDNGTNEASILHIGICYGYRDVNGVVLGKREPKYGDIYIVKNRLPKDAPTDIRPPITTQEVKSAKSSDTSGQMKMSEAELPPWASKLKGGTKDLGPFGCCDCCHGCCNVGPKFPHGTFTGYLYLSPAWFTALARLGHHLGEQGLAKMEEESLAKEAP